MSQIKEEPSEDIYGQSLMVESARVQSVEAEASGHREKELPK